MTQPACRVCMPWEVISTESVFLGKTLITESQEKTFLQPLDQTFSDHQISSECWYQEMRNSCFEQEMHFGVNNYLPVSGGSSCLDK